MRKSRLSILALVPLFCIMFTGVVVYAIDRETVNTVETATLDLTLDNRATRSRGFEILDGNIHDRNGNLVFELDENGYTIYGTKLCENFFIIDFDDLEIDFSINSEPSNTTIRSNNDIFNGTRALYLNTTGRQAVNIGGQFQNTLFTRTIQVRYSSGTPTGVNFGLTNITRGIETGWISNVRPSNNFARWPQVLTNGDSFQVRASAEGRAGNATMQVQRVF